MDHSRPGPGPRLRFLVALLGAACTRERDFDACEAGPTRVVDEENAAICYAPMVDGVPRTATWVGLDDDVLVGPSNPEVDAWDPTYQVFTQHFGIAVLRKHTGYAPGHWIFSCIATDEHPLHVPQACGEPIGTDGWDGRRLGLLGCTWEIGAGGVTPSDAAFSVSSTEMSVRYCVDDLDVCYVTTWPWCWS